MFLFENVKIPSNVLFKDNYFFQSRLKSTTIFNSILKHLTLKIKHDGVSTIQCNLELSY